MTPRVHDVQRTVVSGIPTHFTPESSGPPSLALMFRVGQADEPLASSGLTHLVEHLAMHELGRTPYASNAFVEDTRTVMWAAGRPDELRGFLSTVTTSLGQLPMERLSLERDLLAAETSRRGRAVASEVFRVTRYGGGPYGLPSLNEYGLRRATEDEVTRWADRYFRPENAVLAVSGFDPSDLVCDLRPGGTRHPVPEPDPPYLSLPGWEKADVTGVGLSMHAERSSAFSAAMVMFIRRLEHRFRHELALCYGVDANRTLMGRRQHVELWLSSVPQRAGDVMHECLQLIDALDERGFAASELQEWRDSAERAEEADPVAATMAWLDALAYDELTGNSIELAELLRRADDVTPEAALTALLPALGSLLALVPPDVDVSDERLTRAPQSSTERIASTKGRKPRKHRPKAPYELLSHRIESSPEGLTLLASKTEFVSVPFAGATVLAAESGHRQLIGRDGFRITVDPVLWSGGESLLALIDASVPAEAVVPLDPIEREKPARQISLPTKVAATVLLWFMALATLVAMVVELSDPAPATSAEEGGGAFTAFLFATSIATVLSIDLRRDLRDRRLRKRLS